MLRNFNIAHRIASHRIASHRIASHRIASHRIASRRYRAKRRARARGRVFTDNTILPVAKIPISEDNLAPL